MPLVADFERWAHRQPAARAVDEVSYRELNGLANAVAHELLEAQAGPLVGLLCPHGLEALIGVLGILKAGAAYLALDPGLPADRVDRLLAEAGVGHVLGPAQFQGLRPVSHNPARRPGELMYVLYTSGSSGEPRGVRVTHANVERLFPACAGLLTVDETQTWSHLHPVSFGFSVWEIWGALAHGGRLVTVPRGPLFDPDECLRLWERQRVTVASLTPSAFRVIATGGTPTVALDDLRTLIFSGEPLDARPLKFWLQAYPNMILLNMYALTETAGEVACHRVTEADLERSRPCLGRPLPDVEIRLIDDELKAVDEGEILVLGPMVADGYLNRPQLTRERFLNLAGRPAYRTGDRGRWLPTGELEFVGRVDRQLKVRGQRVEPQEIEAELRRIPGIADAVVVLRQDRLVAYLILTQPGASELKLRQQLLKRLPAFKVPHRFLAVPSLPLTSHGKLDCAALEHCPAVPLAENGVPPRNEVEAQVARIWEEVLDIKPIGVHDDFLNLGGHSLLATQVLSRVQETFQVRISIQSFFEIRTVAQMAGLVARKREEFAV